MAPVTAAQAKVALAGYKRQNFKVDPNSQQQLDMYIEMRSKFQRVSGGQFVKYLQSGRESMAAGTKSQMAFWAVPKGNFPNGLPKKIQQAEFVPGDDAPDLEVDHETFFVIDQCIPRGELGKNVWTVTSYTSTESSFKTKGKGSFAGSDTGGSGSATGGSGSSKGDPGTVIVVGPGTGSADASGTPGTPAGQVVAVPVVDNPAAGTALAGAARPGRNLRGHPSDAFNSDEFGEPCEEPAAKQARLVRETLQTLRRNIDEATAAGVWVSSNRLCNNSVHFWVEQTVGALEEMVRDAGANRSKTQGLVHKFMCYLQQLALNSDCFPYWHHFKGFFPRLVEAGGSEVQARVIDEAKLLENLAQCKETDEGILVEGVSSLTRAQFYNSAIYRSFVNHRVNKALETAQQATANERRCAALDPWKDAQGLPQALSSNICVALKLFQPQAPLADRISVMFGEGLEGCGSLIKMARHWDPRGELGAAAMMGQETPDFKDISYKTFCDAARGILEANLADRIENPLVQSAVTLVGELGAATGAATGDFRERLLAHCLHVRFSIVLPQLSDGEHSEEFVEAIPKDQLNNVFKRVREFFAGFASPPAWFATLKAAWTKEQDVRAKVKKDKAEQAAASDAAADVAGAAAAPPPAPATPGVPDAPATGASGAGTAVPRPLKAGDEVIVTFGRGNNAFNGKKAMITSVLAHHCWVNMMEGQEEGTSKKVATCNLKLAEEGPGDEAFNCIFQFCGSSYFCCLIWLAIVRYA